MSRVRDQMERIQFCNLPNPSGRIDVHSYSKRNEYQKQKNNFFGGVERARCVRLTKLPPCVSRFSRQCEVLNISQTYRPPRPVAGIALLFFTFNYFIFLILWMLKLKGKIYHIWIYVIGRYLQKQLYSYLKPNEMEHWRPFLSVPGENTQLTYGISIMTVTICKQGHDMEMSNKLLREHNYTCI
jgi:hypothetical protein